MKFKTVIILLLLSLFLLADRTSPEKERDFSIKKAPLLEAMLEDLAEIYRQTPRLTPEVLRDFQLKKLTETDPQEAQNLRALLQQQAIRPKKFIKTNADGSRQTLTMLPLEMELLLSSERQQRWNNPPFDVLEVMIFLRSDDASVLNGINLKKTSSLFAKDGAIISAEIPGTELYKLKEIPEIKRVAPVLKQVLNNDRGTYATGVDRLRLQEGGIYTKGYTGKGVIVGIVDTGLDWTHEDFIDPQTGKSRVLYLWDTSVTTAGKTPADLFGGNLSGLTSGTVWTKDEIDSGACTAIDTQGHGTHVAGTAAGNGRATGKYTGMAPNADLIIVKGLTNNGVLFIYDLASRLGRPCSVNMSYGPGYPIHIKSYYPYSYTSDDYESEPTWFNMLNSIYGGGHIPVNSAGNSGHWPSYTDLSGGTYPYKEGGSHMGGTFSGAFSRTLTIPDYAALWNQFGWGNPSATDYPQIYIGFWYDQPIQVWISNPEKTVTYGPFVHGAAPFALSGPDGTITAYFNNSPSAVNGLYWARIDIRYYAPGAPGNNYCPTPGDWEITVAPVSSGATYTVDAIVADFDVYMGSLYYLSSNIYTAFKTPEAHQMYLGTKANASAVISVASYNTRTSWTSINSYTYRYTRNGWLDAISDFSSPGPSRDRRLKPDIAAPGYIIVSSLSKDYSISDTYKVDDKHIIMQGTSMAAPHVTGGIALLLEKWRMQGLPMPTVNRVTEIIQSWATVDLPVNSWGPEAFGAGKFNLVRLNDAPVARITVNKNALDHLILSSFR